MNKKLVLPLMGIFLISGIFALVTYVGLIQFDFVQTNPLTINGNEIGSTITFEDVDCEGEQSCLSESIRLSNDANFVNWFKLITESEVDTEYVGKLELTKKDMSDWSYDGTYDKAEIVYTAVGDSFEVEGVPEGYTLIYYKDNVANENDAGRLVTIGGIGPTTQNIPHENDWNVGEEADYCNNGFDNYEHCKGAKLWAVPDEDIVNDELTWEHMSDYYYETDLIYYFANSDGIVNVPANSYLDVYVKLTPDKYLPTGKYSVNVTAE